MQDERIITITDLGIWGDVTMPKDAKNEAKKMEFKFFGQGKDDEKVEFDGSTLTIFIEETPTKLKEWAKDFIDLCHSE